MSDSEMIALLLKKMESMELRQKNMESIIKDGFKEAEIRDEELDKLNEQRFVKIETKIENVLEPHLQLHGEANADLRGRVRAMEKEKMVGQDLKDRVEVQEGVSQILANRIDHVEDRVTVLENEKSVR